MIPATMATNMTIANITVITLYMANSSFRLLTALCKCAFSYHYMVQADVVDLRQVMRIGLQHGDPLGVDDSVYFAIGVI